MDAGRWKAAVTAVTRRYKALMSALTDPTAAEALKACTELKAER